MGRVGAILAEKMPQWCSGAMIEKVVHITVASTKKVACSQHHVLPIFVKLNKYDVPNKSKVKYIWF